MRGRLFVIVVVTQAIGLAFLPAPHAGLAYKSAVLGCQTAAQEDLLRPALDFKAFKSLEDHLRES